MDSRRDKFAHEYIKDLNATQAAIRAGYSAKTAASMGSQLLRNIKVAAKIAQLKAKVEDKALITAVDVLREMARLSTVDVTDIFLPDGSIKPFHEMSENTRRCIASVEYADEGISLSAKGIEATPRKIKKIKFWDKNVSLTNLAKHFTLLNGKTEDDDGQMGALLALLKAVQK